MKRVPLERLSPLPPLPPLVRGVVDGPGSPYLPAVEVHVPRDVSREERGVAMRALRDGKVAMLGVWTLVHSGGRWSHGSDEPGPNRRFAVATNLLTEHSTHATLDHVDAAATFLARRLGGVTEGSLDRGSILPRMDAIHAAVEAHGRYRLDVELDDEADVVDLRDALHRLGVRRGDFGTYAWDVSTHLGRRRVLVVDPGPTVDLDLPLPGCVAVVVVKVDLTDVPVPEVVVARACELAAGLTSVFGGHVVGRDRYGRRVEKDGSDPEIARHLAALRAVGFHRDVRLA